MVIPRGNSLMETGVALVAAARVRLAAGAGMGSDVEMKREGGKRGKAAGAVGAGGSNAGAERACVAVRSTFAPDESGEERDDEKE